MFCETSKKGEIMSTHFGTGISVGSDGREAAKAAVSQAKSRLEGKEIHLAIVYTSSKYDYKQVVETVRTATDNAPLIGCSTSGEFTEKSVLTESVAVGLLSSDDTIFYLSLATGLNEDPLESVNRAVAELPKEVEGHPKLAAIMLHDGLVGKGEECVLSAAAAFGTDIKFVGGSAADDLKFEATPVFVNDRIETNAVAICLMASKHEMFTSVKHGHKPLSGELTVTRANDNVLYEVDGRPAWDVWKEQTSVAAKELGIDVNTISEASEVGSFLIRFELGLATDLDEYKVRVPLSKNDDGSLNFACTIAEGAKFRIMQSPEKDQIEAARTAAERAMAQSNGAEIAGALVFDCCCRGIILGDNFAKGIDAIKSEIGDIPLLGWETYGEICMDPGQFSGYHNTTTVVSLILK